MDASITAAQRKQALRADAPPIVIDESEVHTWRPEAYR